MTEFAIKGLLATVFLGGVLNLAGLLTWVERKQSAVMQDRIGANRAQIWFPKWLFPLNALLWLPNKLGLFHSLADAVKMFLKEDFVPAGADRFLHTLAPAISVTFALLAFASIPFGDTIEVAGRVVNLQIADVNAGVLFVFAMMSLGVYGVILAGFASNSNYAYLGGLRAASQMLSYEITMGISIMGIVLCYGTLGMQEIVRHQGAYFLGGWLPAWGIVVQPLAFFLFMTAALAETKRVPFDLPEGESEIVGYFVEYSGMKFGMFFLTDLVETVLVACLMTTFFLGGWQVPYLHADGFHFPWGADVALAPIWVSVLKILSFMTKVAVFNWLFMQIRWTLPRFRYDQLMHLGWKILFPASLVNTLVTSVVVVWRS
jgi:NADH-quinone oxidoreductase subunit H